MKNRIEKKEGETLLAVSIGPNAWVETDGPVRIFANANFGSRQHVILVAQESIKFLRRSFSEPNPSGFDEGTSRNDLERLSRPKTSRT